MPATGLRVSGARRRGLARDGELPLHLRIGPAHLICPLHLFVRRAAQRSRGLVGWLRSAARRPYGFTLPGRITMRRCTFVPAAVGAAIRVLHLLYLRARDPLFAIPVADSREHLAKAWEIANTGILLPHSAAFYKGPLYSYFLAALLRVLPRMDQVVVAARVSSLLFSVVSIWLVARIALLLGGPQAAWAAGLAAALYGTEVYFSGTVLLTPLVTLFLLAGGYTLLRAGTGNARPAPALLVAGLLLGLAAITRANALLCAPAMLAYVVHLSRVGELPGIAPSRAAVLLAGGVLLAVAPVTGRNVLVAHDPVLISSNGGINLFMGNDPGFDQWSGNWHSAFTWSRIARTPQRLGLVKGGAQQRFFLRQAVSRATANPVGQLALLGRKLAILFSSYEIPNNRRISQVRRYSAVLRMLTAGVDGLRLPFSLMIPLALAGVFLALRLRVRRWGLAVALAAAYALTPVLFFNTARYRLPAVMLLLPVAAAGWAQAWRSHGHRSRLWWPAAVVAVSVLGASMVIGPHQPGLPPSDEVYLAEEAVRLRRCDEVPILCRRAVVTAPQDPLVREQVANTLSDCGDWRPALRQYRVLGQLAAAHGLEWSFTALHGQGRCLAALGQTEAALAAYSQALRMTPDAPVDHGRPLFHLRGVPPFAACETRLPMALLLTRLGRPEEAGRQLDFVLVHCGQDADLSRRAGRLRRHVEELEVTGTGARR